MSTNNKTVRIFTMPQQFPCGPQSACCGPIGQTDEEVTSLKETIENELKVQVEVRNVIKGEDMRDFLGILKLFRSFGPMALPIIALDDEVVSMGNPMPNEVVSVLRGKMKV